jgi:AcrR family transcriptional regulator
MIDAALELIIEQGTAVSMMAIGQRSGFSHGLVLARFGSKAGLLEAVAQEAQRRFATGVSAISSEVNGIAKLHSIIDVYFQPPSADAEAFYILFGESLGPDRQLHAAFQHADTAFRRYISDTLRHAQDQQEVSSSLDTEGVATLIVGMLRGVALQHLMNRDAVDQEAMRSLAHDFVGRLLDLDHDRV